MVMKVGAMVLVYFVSWKVNSSVSNILLQL